MDAVDTPAEGTAELIRRLHEAGLKQIQISRLTKIPQPRLSRWAAGVVPSSADDALKLRELLDQVAAPPPAGPDTQEGERAAA
ncbi:MAG: helix-turn-helix transcriptional regulator [Inhella sp.]|nr:helix-turn-helix transcriptional regulator [Inhella sp.]